MFYDFCSIYAEGEREDPFERISGLMDNIVSLDVGGKISGTETAEG
jgi:hypothetical protein